ncbi:MAG: hypothetical protein OXI48_02005, partial [bacterium]|nr:hypothetical protein [bacterium]
MRRALAWLAATRTAALAAPAAANEVMRNFDEDTHVLGDVHVRGAALRYTPEDNDYFAQRVEYSDIPTVRVRAIGVLGTIPASLHRHAAASATRIQIIDAVNSTSGVPTIPQPVDRSGNPIFLGWGQTGEMTIFTISQRLGLAQFDLGQQPPSVRADYVVLHTQSPGGRARHPLIVERLGSHHAPSGFSFGPRVLRRDRTTNQNQWLEYQPLAGQAVEIPLVLLGERPPVPRRLDIQGAMRSGSNPTLMPSPATVESDGEIRIPMLANHPLDSGNLPPASAFSVRAGGSRLAVASVRYERAGAGVPVYNGTAYPSDVILTMVTPVPPSVRVSGRYADPTRGDDTAALQDEGGVDAPSFVFDVTTGRNASTATEYGLVGNIEETAGDAVAAAREGRWQPFSFSTADAQAGWRPTKLEVVVAEAADGDAIEAALYAVSGGEPTKRLATIGRKTVSAAGTVEFDLPATAAFHLLDETYAVHLRADAGTPKLGTTASDDESTAFFTSWQLGDAYWYWKTEKTGESDYADGDRALRVRLTGGVNLPAEGYVRLDGDFPPDTDPASQFQSTAYVGVELIAAAWDVSDANGLPPESQDSSLHDYSWWKVGGTELLGDGISFTPGSALAGEVIEARASFLDGAGNRETLKSRRLLVSANRAPVFADDAPTKLQVSEHAPVYTNVGDPIVATDPDGHEVLYSLFNLPGTGPLQFQMEEPSSGQVQTIALLDYESRALAGHAIETYALQAEDIFGGLSRRDLRIEVLDGPNVNVEPVQIPVAGSDRQFRYRAQTDDPNNDVEAGARVKF